MTLPPLEPRSSTLDAMDAIIERATHARVFVFDEVAHLASEIDRLRAELRKVREQLAESDGAIVTNAIRRSESDSENKQLRAALLLAKEERDTAIKALKEVIGGPRDLG